MEIKEGVNLVTFKSSIHYFAKERSNIKNNTVRKKDENDNRFKLLDDFIDYKIDHLFLKITTVLGGDSFIRQIKDVSKWEDLYIISWFV